MINKIINKVIHKEKWGYNFPLSNGGGVQGINDAGVETFNGKPNKYLTKEIIQNSLDARVGIEPVIVSFSLIKIEALRLPFKKDLLNIFSKCHLYWEKQENKKAVDFINNGIKKLNDEELTVLQISDSNTTGLRGVGKFNGKFAELVTDAGVSNKKSSDGGSFGIGKNAPFSCSHLRTIIYSTLNDEGDTALQGVSRLLSHRDNSGKITQGKGFLGIERLNEVGDIMNEPFIDKELNDIDSLFIQKEQGTTISIIGYKEQNNWNEEIVQAVLEYYMVAIIDGKLEVIVDEEKINKDTIESIIYKYKEKFEQINILEYYRAYTEHTENIVVIKEDFYDMGEIELHILIDDKLEGSKSIAYVRSNGMKIIDKKGFRTISKFSGVLIFRGIKINGFIRGLENPSHDKIEYNRSDSPNKAKKILSDLARFVRDKINEVSRYDDNEILEVEGLAKYLPIEDEKKIDVSIKKGVNKKLENVKINKTKKINKAKKIYSNEGNEDGEDTGGNIAERKKPNNKKNNELDKNADKGNRIKNIDILKSRIFNMDKQNGVYRVNITSKNSGNIYIRLKIIGEVGFDNAQLLQAIDCENREFLDISTKGFGPVKFKKNQNKKFEVKIEGKELYSMEVETNEDKL